MRTQNTAKTDINGTDHAAGAGMSQIIAGDVSQQNNPFHYIPQDILARVVTVAMGRTREDKNWKNVEAPFASLMKLLSEFQRGDKNGTCIIQGKLVGAQRQAKDVLSCDLMMFDYDTGVWPADAYRKIEAAGYFCVMWSTHSHMKTTTDVAEAKLTQFRNKNKMDGVDDVELVRQYLRTEKRVEAWVLDSITSVAREHKEGGVTYVVHHAPMPRFRVLFVLDKSFVFAQRGNSQAEAIQEWKERYAGMSTQLGLPYDRSCVDPSRLMYLPRIAPDANIADHLIWPTPGGSMVDIDAVRRVIPGRDEDDPDAAVFTALGQERIKTQTPGLFKFVAEHGLDFQAADWLQAIAPEDVRPGGSGDKINFRCPNEDGHSVITPDDAAFMVSNGDGASGFWMGCHHDTCKGESGGDRVWYLDRLCKNYEQTVDDLLLHCREREEGQNRKQDDGDNLAKRASKHKDHRSNTVAGATATAERKQRGPTADETNGLPSGYYRRNGAIWYRATSANAETSPVRVCQAFSAVARVRDENGDGAGVEIAFLDEEKRKTFVVRSYELHKGADELRGRLADAGLEIELDHATKFMRLLSKLEPDDIVINVSKPGWHGDVYVTPIGQVVTARGEILIVAPGAKKGWRLADGAGAKDRSVRGSLETWKSAVMLPAVASLDWAPHHLWGLMTGCAGALAERIGLPPGGFYYQGVSSCGKSTTQALAASCAAVVGPAASPGRGMLLSCRSTVNAVERLCANANDATLCLDEAGAATSNFMEEIAFLFTSGSGKQRMSRDTSLREGFTWRGMITISGEKPLEAYLKARGIGEKVAGGVHARLSTIRFTKGDPARKPDVDVLQRGASENYGHALPTFAAHLITRYTGDAARAELCTRRTKLADMLGDGQPLLVKRAADRFAAVWLTGELMQEAGLLPNEANIESAVRWAWNAFAGTDDAGDLDPLGAAVDRLRAWCASHGQTHIQNWSERVDENEFQAMMPDTTRPSWQGWFGRRHHDVLFLLADKLQEIVGSTVSARDLATELYRRGVLARKGKNNTWSRGVPMWPPVVHYRINLTALNADAGSDDVPAGSEEAPAPTAAPGVSSAPVVDDPAWCALVEALVAHGSGMTCLQLKAALAAPPAGLPAGLMRHSFARTEFATRAGRYVLGRQGSPRGALYSAERVTEQAA